MDRMDVTHGREPVLLVLLLLLAPRVARAGILIVNIANQISNYSKNWLTLLLESTR